MIVVDMDVISKPYVQADEKKLVDEIVGRPFNQEVTRAFGYGGSSNLWHGVFTKLDEEDWRFLDRAAGVNISSEVKPLYGELKFAFGELPGKTHVRSPGIPVGNDLYEELELSAKFQCKDFFIQKRPFRARDALSRLKKSCRDLVFVENATALYLIGSRDDPSRAMGLVVNVNQQLRTVEADYFILAAGALETPRIVLQGNEDGHFRIENNNIGKYLVDHPWVVIGEIISKRGWFRMGLSEVYAAPGLRYRIGYRLQESIDNPRIGTNHCITIKPLFFGDYSIFKEAMKSIISQKPSPKAIFRMLKRFRIRDIFASLFLLVCEKFGLGVFVRRCLVFCYLEQPVRAESSVSLAPRLDSLGRRIPMVKWSVGDEEAEGVANVKKNLSDALSGSRRFSFCPYDSPAGSLASGAHHAGTMRIGRNCSDGVVDKNLMVFGTNNVFVCDSSIFPNYGNSNPTLTLSAFSLRLSRHLISTLSPDSGK